MVKKFFKKCVRVYVCVWAGSEELTPAVWAVWRAQRGVGGEREKGKVAAARGEEAELFSWLVAKKSLFRCEEEKGSVLVGSRSEREPASGRASRSRGAARRLCGPESSAFTQECVCVSRRFGWSECATGGQRKQRPFPLLLLSLFSSFFLSFLLTFLQQRRTSCCELFLEIVASLKHQEMATFV